MKYFLIGDKVYVPRLKIIGTVSDKMYQISTDELKVKVKLDNIMTNKAFQSDIFVDDEYWTEYSKIKSMKSVDIYKNKTMEEEPTDINSLNISNLLRKKDIVEGTEVKIVDNYFLERMMSYGASSRLFSLVRLSELYNKGKATLTGDKRILDNGEISVKCRFEDCDSYYIYMNCLQVTKRMNIFRKIRKFIKNNPILLLLLTYAISISIAGIVIIISKLV